MDLNAIAEYLPLFGEAALLTVKLGVLGIIFSIIIGLICAVVQYYKVPVIRRIVSVYIEISRNTPLLVQLFFIQLSNIGPCDDYFSLCRLFQTCEHIQQRGFART